VALFWRHYSPARHSVSFLDGTESTVLENWQAKESIGAIAASVTFCLFLFSYFTLRVNFHANARQSFMNAVYDGDRQMMNNPDLWTVFDSNDFGLEPKSDAESVARRTSFMYFYFNLFETAYLYHRKSGVLGILRNQESYDALDRRVRNFFTNSQAARTLWRKHEQLYEKSFRAYLDPIVS
jgi:hypothetical protein